MEMLGRTVVLSLAWFAGVSAIASALAATIGRRLNGSVHPGWLLTIRLFPAVISILFVVAVFLPAQWAFEPRDVNETLGLAWYAVAAAGALLLLRSTGRAFSIARVARRLRFTERPGAAGIATVYEVDGVPGISLAGVLHPRIVIGSRVSTELSSAELDVAIAHEVAHRNAFDNVARWCMLCAPDFLSGSPSAMGLEQAWRVAAESRADARATNGDHVRAVHLASALIKVARLSAQSADSFSVPSWSTLNDDSALLEWRVHRLVNGRLMVENPVLLRVSAALFGVIVLASAPVFAGTVHRLTEALVALLP